MGKKFTRAFLTATACTLAISTALTSVAFGAVKGIVAQDKVTKAMSHYSMDELVDSLMGDKVLFNDFKAKTTLAYEDDKAGYVDFNYLTDQLMELGKKNFNLNKVTEGAQGPNVLTIKEEIKERKLGEDGKPKDGPTHNKPIQAGPKAEVVEVDDSLIGVYIISVKLTGVDDPSKYSVTILGKEASYYAEKGLFKVKSDKSYKKEDIKDSDIIIKPINGGQSDTDAPEVIDIS